MIQEHIIKGRQTLMESLIEHFPTLVAAALVIGGGVFSLVRWLFAKEDRRREQERAARDLLTEAKRETEEKIWARANETIDRLREEVRMLRCDNELLREKITVLEEKLSVLTNLLEEKTID
jgi:predicted RNase H-like nuclease (RuvC/YqgF family)